MERTASIKFQLAYLVKMLLQLLISIINAELFKTGNRSQKSQMQDTEFTSCFVFPPVPTYYFWNFQTHKCQEHQLEILSEDLVQSSYLFCLPTCEQ